MNNSWKKWEPDARITRWQAWVSFAEWSWKSERKGERQREVRAVWYSGKGFGARCLACSSRDFVIKLLE